MNRNYAHRQKTTGLIRYSCGILFMLFSFCYLYFLQGEILAEAQFVYSKGVTTYDLLIGAIVITVVLQIVQWIVAWASQLPSTCHALSYLPSMLILAIITDVNKKAIMHFSFGAWLWIAPLVLLIYVVLVFVMRRINIDYERMGQDVKSQLYPNYIILFLFIIAVGSIPQSSDVYHYELKTERLILAHDYEGAAEVGRESLRASTRLTQLRMYALAKQGLLAEHLFEYPQYYGSRGLLDVSDTLSCYRFSARNICLDLGAFCGASIHSTQRYYQLMLSDSLWNQRTADYYLCSLLLDKNLAEFYRQLPRYYHIADTVPHAYDHLPKAYREALLLIGHHDDALHGKIVIGRDTVARYADQEMIRQFREYDQMKIGIPDETERINMTHRLFGQTYWWYYDYSHLAKGELHGL